jgi:serine/threonine protein kinase
MGQAKPDRIFISYAHEDAHWREEFERMLAPAGERGLIGVWSDESITAGEDWSARIHRALESSRIGLLLVTDHFLKSEFINRVELAKLLTAAKQGGVSIRWVPVSASLYRYTDLNGIQACWDPERPLDKLTEADRKAAIQKICVEIVEEFGAAPKVSVGRRENLRDRVQERLGGKYTIAAEVGIGKFSIVYRAERKHPSRSVGVKVFVASELDDWARRLFIEGLQRADELSSAAFIKIFDHFMDDSPEFLVTEFVEGEKLSTFMRAHPRGLPLGKVKSILLDLTRAIEEAHERGWRRGEMCPSDILLEPSGLPRLSAFDFSNMLREQAQLLGNFLVDRESLAYMTPERFYGQEPSFLTDQYSLGMLATELLGGVRIPRVVRPCDLEIKRGLFAELESGKGEWASRSSQFTGIVCRMLRIDPEARWPSMTVVRDLLREIEIEESPEELHRKMAMTSYLRFQALGVEGERKFFTKFYENLFTALPEVEVHFQSIDMERQHRILNGAIHTLLNFRPDSPEATKTLDLLAARHANLGITDRHYAIFLDALEQTIEELGEKDADLRAAWRAALLPGVEFMRKAQQKHETAPPPPKSPKTVSRRGKRSPAHRPAPRA